jgi:hypothetical protein
MIKENQGPYLVDDDFMTGQNPEIIKERKALIREIVGFKQGEYSFYNLSGGFPPRKKDMYAAVFAFIDHGYFSIQIDNLDKQLLFPPELWDYLINLRIKNKEVINYLKQGSAINEATFLQRSTAIQTIYMKDLPIAGMVFFGRDPRQPKKIGLFNHQEIPVSFSIRELADLAVRQRQFIRKLL